MSGGVKISNVFNPDADFVFWEGDCLSRFHNTR